MARTPAAPSAQHAFGLLLTAALCGVLSWASLRWSPLPGRPLVDAAGGFALVAVLALGWRAAPAIWLGVLLGRWLWASSMPDCGHGNCQLLLTASVHALAEVAQAGLGAWLLQRNRQAWNGLDEPHDIWAFFLRAAAGPCLLGTLLATTYHGLYGGMPWSDALPAAGSHWLGAVLGVMVGAPIALAWVALPRAHWSPRRWPVTLTGLTCVVLVQLGVVALAAADARRTQTEFGHGVRLAATLAEAELQRTVQAVRAMRMLFAGSAEVTDAEFRAATSGWLSTPDEGQAIGWIDCPRQARPTPSAPRVRLVEPASFLPAADGANWFTHPAAEAAMAQALRSGRPTASAPVLLEHDGRAGGAAASGVVVFQAVPQMWRPGEGCGQSASGVVFAILPLRRLAEVLGPAVSPPLALCLLDRSGASDGQPLVGATDCQAVPAARRQVESLLLGDRRWELLVYDRSRTAVHGTEVVAGVSTAGMMGATALMMLLLTVTGRARRIEAAVAEAEAARRAAESASLAKTSFLSRMSHELRTPLNAVLGFAQLLETAGTPALAPPHQKWASNIRQAGDHLLAMINDILDLSRIESDTLHLSIVSLSVESLVGETVTLVEQRAAQRGVAIRTELGPGAAYLLADATRVRQVLVNLLSNAVKYNREGGEILVLSRRAGSMVEIEVRDTGLGLDATQLAQLFEPFNRLGRERGHVEGTGIGLVISRRLAALMGGQLRVSSEPERGSSFTLALPADDAARRPEAAAADAETAAPAVPPQHIHYVEDNPLNVEIMRAALASFDGIVLDHSMTGQQCLDRLLDHRLPRPDLLLLDLHLPDIDGLDVLKRLKAEPAVAGLPVVVVSADALDSSIEAAMSAGAVEFLTKPIDVARLQRVLARHGRVNPAS
ncbi:MAG: ATP-binding protein [Pseudomonadota bacterium]